MELPAAARALDLAGGAGGESQARVVGQIRHRRLDALRRLVEEPIARAQFLPRTHRGDLRVAPVDPRETQAGKDLH
ncbi:MAG: hypothetical protein R3266_11825, partial [Gemmatimonadota bacterium]|nr:hypothetical protein [Gemmatimonadota bacterium]